MLILQRNYLVLRVPTENSRNMPGNFFIFSEDFFSRKIKMTTSFLFETSKRPHLYSTIPGYNLKKHTPKNTTEAWKTCENCMLELDADASHQPDRSLQMNCPNNVLKHSLRFPIGTTWPGAHSSLVHFELLSFRNMRYSTPSITLCLKGGFFILLYDV